jgi:hypothetical protein
MDHSEQMDQLATALAAAQRVLKGSAKSATNPHLKNRYSTLGDVMDACRDALASHGLSVVQTFEAQDDAGITLRTTLLHQSGQWISGALRMPLEKPSAHAVGSAATYARRYSLAALVGVVADDDDDGAAAVQAAPAAARVKAAPVERAPVPVDPPAAHGEPACPKCGGKMWDDRKQKKNPKAPDFKCRRKGECDGVYWPGEWKGEPLVAAPAGPAFDDVPPFDEEGR